MISQEQHKYGVLHPHEHETKGGHMGARHHFHEEGVVVTVPNPKHPEQKKARPVAKQLGLMNDKDDPFKPGRIAINLSLEHESDPSQYVTKFDPPIELRVHITPEDEKRAGHKNFKLVYWNGTKWEPLKEESIEPSPDGGEDVTVLLSEWPEDPATGLFP